MDLKYFMWGYQPHFRISAQVAAEGLFKLLDAKLAPSIFLVGVLYEERENRHPICLEPEDCGYDPILFSEVKEMASHLEAIDEERLIIHSHPLAQENHDRSLKMRALRDAIQTIVNRNGRYNGLESFCSMPVPLDGFMVCVVLQLCKAVYDTHYRLQHDKVDERYSVSTSLLDACISEFQEECVDALSKPNPGSASMMRRGAEEMIRAAGTRFMYTPAWYGQEFTGLHWMFYACNAISSLKLENAESVGEMLVARRQHPNIEVVLRLEKPVDIQNFRGIRKLLEVSGQDLSILTDSGYVYGYGRHIGTYDHRNEDLYKITFIKHHTWEISHADHPMMVVQYGQPRLPSSRIDKTKFFLDLPRIFPGISETNIKHLWDVVEAAMKQNHGTILIISTEAESEAIRLESQCTRIVSMKIDPGQISLVTSIDGAVLLDSAGTCYAIGVILDGYATPKGNPSRGARYNSALRYVHSHRNCLGVVVSEDGMVDLIPDLMPQIKRSDLISKIDELEQMAGSESVEAKAFYKVMEWLNKHRFYCLPDMCEKINLLRRQIEQALQERLHIVYHDIEPHEDMNESFFTE